MSAGIDDDSFGEGSNDGKLPGDPAEVGPRLGAGIFDWFFVVGFGAVLSLAPMVFGGFALPMLGAFTAILVYSIVPAALFKATMGMRIFGLEIVSMSGRPADFGELAFRELVGRGMFGFAYFATSIIGIAGYLSGSMALFQPRGMGLFLFLMSGLLIMLSAVGHFLILVKPDRRGLHDMMARTVVVRRGTVKEPGSDIHLDEEEKRAAERKSSQRAIKFAVFCVVMSGLTVAIPYVMSRPTASPNEFRDRVRDEVRAKQDEVAAGRDAKKEAAIRATLERDPKDEEAFSLLLTMLEDQERTADARAAFEAFVAADPNVEKLAGFGVWLYEHEMAKDAVPVLEKAIAGGFEGGYAHVYLGFALIELGEKSKARIAFREATKRDPELVEAREELKALDAELGPSAD